MRRGLLAFAAVAALAAAPVVHAALPEEPVFASPRNERNPAADRDTGGTDVWAFTRNRTGFLNRYDAYVKIGTNAAIKLNTSGQGWTGGVDYPTVVYQRVYRGQSNIFLYDLSDGSRPATPSGVNTDRWEWHPTISGDWLLFGRDNNLSPTQRVILHNGVTHENRLLSSVTRAAHYLQADQVNGDWATFTRCTPVCNVVRYQISTQARMVLAKPVTSPRRQQYASSVTSAGVVYLVRSRPTCGASVRIVRYDPSRGDPATGRIVVFLPAGRDVFFSHVRENADGSVDVFYDRVNCSTGRWDIYKATQPAPAP
jgi:hypothetical protein